MIVTTAKDTKQRASALSATTSQRTSHRKGASEWKRKEAVIIASMNGVMNELILVADAFAISQMRICGNQR